MAGSPRADESTMEAAMRHASLIIVILTVICAVGCATGDHRVVKAETTGKGEYILYRWEVGGEKRYRVLTEDYAMMIFYDASAKNAKPLFCLHDRKACHMLGTTNVTLFKERLARIPAGETLHSYNTCCGGTHHAMDRSVIEEIRDFCREAGIRFDDGPLHTICTCL